MPDIEIWNHHASSSQRTTNSVEGWHCKLNKKFGKAHPNIWTSMEVLKSEVSDVDRKILMLASGQPIKKPARKYQKVNQTIARLIERYQLNAITPMELAVGASCAYN